MKWAAWMLSAVLALVAGCAAMQDPASTKVEPGQGLLAARLAAHVPGGLIRSVGVRVSLRKLDDHTAVNLSSTNVPRANTAVFLQPLPPGRYRLDRVYTHRGDGPLTSLPGEFEIAANRVTDLGLIVLVFANLDREQGFFTTRTGRYLAVQEISEPDTAALLAGLAPELRARLGAGEPLRPALHANGELNRRVLAAAKAHAGIVSWPTIAPGRPVAIGRVLGQILTWEPAAERWRAYDTGRNLEVLSAAFALDGSLLAGMEQGVILSNRGGAWHELARTGGSGPVEFVGQAASSEYFALTRELDGYRLLSARDPQAGWSVARSFPAGRAQAWLAAGKLVVIARPEDRGQAAIHVFDPGTRQWSQAEGTTDERVEVLHDGGIVASSRGYRVLNVQRSRGLGASAWRSLRLDETLTAHFVDQGTAYRTLFTAFGADPHVRTIERSEDGGATWSRSGQVRDSWRLLALPKENWLLSSTAVGELSVSSDGGASWQPLRVKPE